MLNRHGLDYIDLVYLHQLVVEYTTAWNRLIEVQKAGKVQAIGISNLQYFLIAKFLVANFKNSDYTYCTYKAL